MSAMQRRKGASAEREIARLLGDELGMRFERQLSQSRDGGCDLIVGPFALEVKRHESNPLRAWWTQANVSADALHLMPAVAYRPSRQPWRFIVPVDWYALGRQRGWDEAVIMTLQGFCFAVRELMG